MQDMLFIILQLSDQVVMSWLYHIDTALGGDEYAPWLYLAVHNLMFYTTEWLDL